MSSIKRNFSYNFIYQILTLGFSLITSPYIARVLGPEKSGIYSYTYSIANYFYLFAMMGVNNYGNRSIAMARDHKEELSRTFSGIYALQVVHAICASLLYMLYLCVIVKEDKLVAAIQLIYLVASTFDINWLFFGLEKFKLTVTRNIIIKLLTLIGIFLFVHDERDLYLYTLVMAGSYLLSTLALWPYVKRDVKLVRVSRQEIFAHAKPMFVMFIPVVAISIYNVMDKVMLGAICSKSQVGYYDYSERIMQIPTALISALGTVMLPRMSNLAKNGNIEKSREYIAKSMQFILFLSFACTFGIAGIAPVFAPVFLGEKYTACIVLIITLAPIAVFKAWANVVRTQYLIPNGKDKDYVISVVLGAAVNVVINLMLIGKLQALGAVIGTVIAELVVAIYQTIAAKDALQIRLYIHNGWFYAVGGIIMFFSVHFIGRELGNKVITLVLQVIVGGSIYIIISFLYIHFTKAAISNHIIFKKPRRRN